MSQFYQHYESRFSDDDVRRAFEKKFGYVPLIIKRHDKKPWIGTAAGPIVEQKKQSEIIKSVEVNRAEKLQLLQNTTEAGNATETNYRAVPLL